MKKNLTKLIRLAILAFPFSTLIAQKPQEVKMPVTQVNVYLNAAQISHSQKIKFKPGISKYVFTGLAMNIEKEYISLRNLGGAQLLALNLFKITENTEVSSLNEDILASIGRTKDTLISLEKNIAKVSNDILGLELERRMLEKNDNIIGNSKTLTLEELKTTTAYFRERYSSVGTDLETRGKDLAKLKKQKIKMLKSAFSNENDDEENLNFSIIVAEVNNPGAEMAAEPLLVYIARESGWIPMYDVFSTNNKSLKIEYRAKILNNTGLDWINQAITLSTNDPFEYYKAPDLEPFYVGGDDNYDYGNYSNSYQKSNYANNYANNQQQAQQQQKIQNNKEEEILTPDHEVRFVLTKSYNFRSGTNPFYVDVISYDLSPEYIFRSAPKKEQQVYEIARIKDWEKLNLLDGVANIYNNGVFLGRSYISLGNIEDYLELPLGVVDFVYVKHRLVSEYSGKKFLGGDIVATRNYEIKLKNTGTEKIVIELIDQVPVSEVSGIKTEGVEYTDGGEKDNVTGRITWKVEMAPASEKAYLLKYSVTYPRKRGYSPFNKYKVRKIRAKF